MTTLVATQRALKLLSMSNQQTPRQSRQSKRLADAAKLERDGDFEFARKPKRPRTEDQENLHVEKVRTQRATGAAIKSSRSKTPQDDQGTDPSGQPPGRGERAPAANEDDVDARPRGKAGRSVKAWEPSPTPRRPAEASKVPLPTSDTPINNRNKEMRKKGKSNRRSSLGSRGRRASSLIENGQTATPHGDVKHGEFYKHITADGLPEPRRMKQLLMWCGERALPAKPPHGTANASAILGARAIQDQILKDFASRADFSDWFRKDGDVVPRPPTIMRPNPRNAEMDEKLAALEARIQRLQEEKKAWQSIQDTPREIQPLFPDKNNVDGDAANDEIVLPDLDQLEPDERKSRIYLAQEMEPFATVQARTEDRLRRIQASLETEVDQLADHVHKLEHRVLTAGREADTVLSLSASRLKERERHDKTSAGTRDMPMMEVLRGLSSILPGGDG